MDLSLSQEHRVKVGEFQRKHHTAMVALVFTDLVDSVQLKSDLGLRGVRLIQRHHQIVRDLLALFADAEEIWTGGDSFFIAFVRPSEAVRFALLLQSRGRLFAAEVGRSILDRVGIHVGEVVVEAQEGSTKPKDLLGIQVDACNRVMSLAGGNQILTTRTVFDDARAVLKGEDIGGLSTLCWMNHGPYLLKGIEDPLEVCEVGEENKAVLKPPSDSEKAHRCVPPDGEPVLTWRPAVGQPMPGGEWVLKEKLGEGGFGEVWLGVHRLGTELRVFKFCFRAERARSLKRELTLSKVMEGRLGHHPNLVAIRDACLDAPPYYLATDFFESRDLRRWCEEQGGAKSVPLPVKVEIIAQVADAMEAAHEAGVLHRDVKPQNILVSGLADTRQVKVKLADFGVGHVMSEEALGGISKRGFSQTIPLAGTQIYIAPELLAGGRASPQSDIYSLGVVLYQFLRSDFARPLTSDWRKSVQDPILYQDLDRCFAEDPQERFAGAGEFAANLRILDLRRARFEERERVLKESARAREEAERRTALAKEEAHRREVRRAWGFGGGVCAALMALRLFLSQWHPNRQSLTDVQFIKQEEFDVNKNRSLNQPPLFVFPPRLDSNTSTNKSGPVKPKETSVSPLTDQMLLGPGVPLTLELGPRLPPATNLLDRLYPTAAPSVYQSTNR